jgi:hypothetical protein
MKRAGGSLRNIAGLRREVAEQLPAFAAELERAFVFLVLDQHDGRIPGRVPRR